MAKSLKPFKQKDDDDCGIACLVMLSMGRKTYKQALDAIGKSKNDDCLLTSNKVIKSGIDALEIKRANKFIGIKSKSWKTLMHKDQLMLVGCGMRSDGNWHWVVFDGKTGKVYDPDPKKPKSYVPNGRNKKPFRYLAIYP